MLASNFPVDLGNKKVTRAELEGFSFGSSGTVTARFAFSLAGLLRTALVVQPT